MVLMSAVQINLLMRVFFLTGRLPGIAQTSRIPGDERNSCMIRILGLCEWPFAYTEEKWFHEDEGRTDETDDGKRPSQSFS